MRKQIRLIALIAFLAMFIPLSMDMYLPALPQMIDYFHSNRLAVNSTLYLFFFLMAIGMLIFGPLSDKYGRKKILLPCSFVYCFASVACALSPTIIALVVARAFQALSVGALVAISTALVKDSFQGKQRDAILGISQAMSLVAPVIAPVIGAFVIQFFPWQANFIILATLGAIAFVLVLTQKETLAEDDRLDSSVFGSWLNLGNVIKDKGFTLYLTITSIAPLGYMAYVSASSYIYQDFFSLSEMQFGIFYSVNAVATVVASLTFIKASSTLKPKNFTQLNMAMVAVSGILMLTVGQGSPVVFLICFLPCAFFCTLLKPLSTSVLLRQRQTDAGSASSLINFSQTIFSFFGLVLGSFIWPNMILGLGGIILGASLIAFIGWGLMLKAKNVSIAAFDNDTNQP